MEIELKYNFNNIVYYYDVVVDIDDICDYLTPKSMTDYYNMTDKEIIAYKEGIKKFNSNFGANKDLIENDTCFIEFLKNRYELQAREKFNEEYDFGSSID